MENMHRCFISIEFPKEVKEEIKKIRDEIPEFLGKKTEYENLHLTLKFLGEIEDDKIEIIKKKLLGVKFKKLDCKLGSIGVFDETFIRIIWIKIEGCEEIQKRIDEALKDIFGKEKRFMSHVTIARVKSVKNTRKFLKELGKIKFEEINFKIDRFCLMESILKSEGAEYRTLECFREEKYS